MHVVGIVCEYNPFHLGHLYQLNETKRILGEDTTAVCVMSGDFVQRGEAAVFDKFARAEAACRCGADLVAELPLPWCLSSAEGFARGAVSILADLGCDTLSFGSESDDLSALEALADFALDETAQARIHALMDADASLSFARARELAAAEALGEKAALYSNPNDILAVEYLKAVKSLSASLHPISIRRAGAGHDSTAEGEYLSAMQLRRLLKKGDDLSGWIAQPAMEVFRRELAAGRSRDEKLLEIALLSRLYRLSPEDFDRLPDAGGGAGRRLYRALWQSGGLEQTVTAASDKRCTAARMRRMLLCAALGICAEDTKGMPPYIRILASNERGRTHLSRIRGNTAVPIINKTAEIKKRSFQAQKVFKLCAEAHEIYLLGCPMPAHPEPGEDWRKTQVLV